MAAICDNPLMVVIASSQLSAELVIPAGSREMATTAACLAAAQKCGVEVTPAVTAAIEALVKAAEAAPDREHRGVIASGAPPLAGDAEAIAWQVAEAAADASDPYARFAGVPVKIGQVLARITPATAGRAGRSVIGKLIAPTPGRSLNLKLPTGIVRDGDGQLIAQIDGVLRRGPGSAAVFQRLDAPQLAHSAASLSAKGDVLAPAIHDAATIKCGGTVEATGVIGAATIDCGGDLLARAGMTGKGTARIKVGGSLCAKYLEKVAGTVAGDLIIENELMNCDLTVGGAVHMDRGNIRGGTITSTGSIVVAEVGTDRATTHLILGTVPFSEPLAAQLRETKTKLQAHCNTLVAEQRAIAQKEAKATPRERERQTEILFELQSANQNLGKVMAGLEALEVRIREKRTVDLRITRRCAAGVVITIGGNPYTLREAITGPFRIRLNEAGLPCVMREGAAERALAEFTRNAKAAA